MWKWVLDLIKTGKHLSLPPDPLDNSNIYNYANIIKCLE